MKIIKPNSIKKGTYDYKKNLRPIEQAISVYTSYPKGDILFVENEGGKSVIHTEMHPLMAATYTAYCNHLPLTLRPDVIWYCITSAVSVYINKNSEKVRKIFVNHEGQETIEVTVLKELNSLGREDWQSVINVFSEKIAEKLNNNMVELIEADFSTTTPTSRLVSQLVVMDAMQKYFKYVMMCVCGIPEIRVEGEQADWIRIKERAHKIGSILPDLGEWLNTLDEIFDQFINIFDDKVDNEFWNSIYKYTSAKDRNPYEPNEFVSGWLIAFFPFLGRGYKNDYCWGGNTWRKASENKGVDLKSFTYHMNLVPVKCMTPLKSMELRLVGGLGGYIVDEDLALRPTFAYAVIEDKRTSKQNDWDD